MATTPEDIQTCIASPLCQKCCKEELDTLDKAQKDREKFVKDSEKSIAEIREKIEEEEREASKEVSRSKSDAENLRRVSKGEPVVRDDRIDDSSTSDEIVDEIRETAEQLAEKGKVLELSARIYSDRRRRLDQFIASRNEFESRLRDGVRDCQEIFESGDLCKEGETPINIECCPDDHPAKKEAERLRAVAKGKEEEEHSVGTVRIEDVEEAFQQADFGGGFVEVSPFEGIVNELDILSSSGVAPIDSAALVSFLPVLGPIINASFTLPGPHSGPFSKPEQGLKISVPVFTPQSGITSTTVLSGGSITGD